MSKGKYKRERENAKRKPQQAATSADIMKNEEETKDPKPPASNTSGKASTNPQPSRWERFKSHIGSSLFTNQAIAAFTFALAMAAIYQFIILSGQLDTMRTDQRAWLVPTYDEASLKDGDPIGQVFHYTNTGKTPAKGISARFIMNIVHDDDDPMFDYPEKIVTRSDVNVLFPTLREHLGIPLFMAAKYPNVLVYAGDIKQQFLSGKIMFIVYGDIEYDDIYRVHHWVHYCTMTFNALHTTTPPVATKCNEYTNTDDK